MESLEHKLKVIVLVLGIIATIIGILNALLNLILRWIKALQKGELTWITDKIPLLKRVLKRILIVLVASLVIILTTMKIIHRTPKYDGLVYFKYPTLPIFQNRNWNGDFGDTWNDPPFNGGFNGYHVVYNRDNDVTTTFLSLVHVRIYNQGKNAIRKEDIRGNHAFLLDVGNTNRIWDHVKKASSDYVGLEEGGGARGSIQALKLSWDSLKTNEFIDVKILCTGNTNLVLKIIGDTDKEQLQEIFKEPDIH